MWQISAWQECFDILVGLLNGSDSVFVGRIGGSDTDAVAAMLQERLKKNSDELVDIYSHIVRVKNYNGYYDKSESNGKFLEFLNLLLHCYVSSSALTLVDAKLLTLYFPKNLNPLFHVKEIPSLDGFLALVSAISAVQGDWMAFPYGFYETLRGSLNLFRVLEKVLPNKRVLVVSPFSESIWRNWANRHSFFPNFSYPEFELLTLTTPITYGGLPLEYYPHADWFETLEDLKKKMSSIDFDIALLSCGSYAMPLGLHAQKELQKSAIYVGGILQLFFGVMGRRYQNIFFTHHLNESSFISPVEREQFLKHVQVPENSPKEAFGAYF